MRSLFKHLVTKYLERQAKRLLKKHKPKIVAVAGSVGKTSTKLAIAKILSEKYTVLAHESSYNSEIGLPLSLFNETVPARLFNPLAWAWLFTRLLFKYRWSYAYRVVVVELGSDRPGDLAGFLRYLKPQIAVITAVAPEHMENFGTMEAVLTEEFQLAYASRLVLLNASDPLLLTKGSELVDQTVKTFGVEQGDYRFQIGKHGIDGIKGVLNMSDVKLHLQLRLFARQTLFSLTAAAAVADSLKLTGEQIKSGAEKIRPVPGRMNILQGKQGSYVIDDSYNSSPNAAVAALDTLYTLPAKRRLAILGSMNELGAYSKEAHERVGQWSAKLDYLITVGAEARKYLAPAARAAGLSASRIKSFSSPYRAGQFVENQLKAGDAVLVKGSQNRIFTEEAVKYLLINPSDQSQLVRQSASWIGRKAKQFAHAKTEHKRLHLKQLPERLLKPNLKLKKTHLRAIKLRTAIERRWHKQGRPYKNWEEIRVAIGEGKLAKVEPTRDYTPVMRFLNPKLVEIYPPFLKPATKTLLDEVATRWRAKAMEVGLAGGVKLALTGLLMTENYRYALIKSGRLAIDKGPHVLGEAFDIDGCGYYLDGQSINPRFANQDEWAQAFAQMDAQLKAPKYKNYSAYDKRVHDLLREVLKEMTKEQKLHFVEEFPGTTNTVFHICRHPSYALEQ